ncbi:unnamed protein product [Kuraishia capsulata CBS 1993]|uniref:Ras-related protein RSR1 n=1 Tax=Kuraishia capsulata CBS 1993 TaxID=1382522 RepID=W6MND3_9ASCO|nr:uncharacterized protein KUCA_T00004107001 [Kuraishia capsulata CBS 1993]CDK28126.1 unnamed protein product [Kuraishia capsulata CBS 1993]
MRELYIKSGKGFLLVYSVTDESSLKELLAIRDQVLRIKDTANVPMVLIGNKCDLNEERKLTPEDGIAVSKEWGRVPFYETSAMYKINVEDAFVDVVRQIMRKEASASAAGNNASSQEQVVESKKTSQQTETKPQRRNTFGSSSDKKVKKKKKKGGLCTIL